MRKLFPCRDDEGVESWYRPYPVYDHRRNRLGIVQLLKLVELCHKHSIETFIRQDMTKQEKELCIRYTDQDFHRLTLFRGEQIPHR
ncbi:hypothetical protein [Rhizobium glycinendophyticum]|uniref:hypothetical protein n=1 Tax=Rhizobium glycinendophyticum TaxID=2589807 RepID=UPI001FEC57EB|nr:hypothetical protein [Rhizobium glycinendophyticum]